MPLPPSIVSSSSSSSFELALAALPSCRRSPFLPSCRRSPLLNRRRHVIVIVAGVIRCVIVAIGMAVTGRRCRVWDRTYAGEFVVVIVERGKPPWPVATFSTPAQISDQSKPHAPQTTNYDYDNTMTTCLKSANAALSCTNTTGHRQNPANAATTPATAMGRGPRDGSNTTTMGECPSIQQLGNAHRPRLRQRVN
ncbi:hypothetical protein EDB89DRAFT_1909153 [Lactarius sanguifluus]|nr:hypothetical protein EDB89DRAFT_1909153 [Lactarius sanguifluus]